jgi:hypothetical protein
MCQRSLFGYLSGVAGLVEVVAWWVVGVLVWWATVSPISVPETVAAALCAPACALAARAARRAVGARWRVRARWLRWLGALPQAVVADTTRLARLWWGRPDAGGTVQEATLDPSSDPAVATTHRALAAAVLSAAPGSVVMEVEGDELRLHVLTPGPSRLEKAARR